jgi:hypothetical protein
MGMPNKLHVLTDFKHLTHTKTWRMSWTIRHDDLRGNDEYKAYISVFGNYVKAENRRSRFDKEAMWLPPSPMISWTITKRQRGWYPGAISR